MKPASSIKFLLFILLLSLGLSFNSYAGPVMVPVPNVTNLPLEGTNGARDLITTAGLVVGAEDEDFDDSIVSGNVISQDPLPEVEVEEGSAVDLVISIGPVPTTTTTTTTTTRRRPRRRQPRTTTTTTAAPDDDHDDGNPGTTTTTTATPTTTTTTATPTTTTTTAAPTTTTTTAAPTTTTTTGAPYDDHDAAPGPMLRDDSDRRMPYRCSRCTGAQQLSL